ncbi:MAG TPA: lysylphosphatidylglycerol synthase transmembrane domain-containing protein [Kofleriaceae bacterium]|nr:lysylphosphatidylglycerol synthase transmembrane domain-containing protein [Kofleriaceae bacterium]
MRRHWPRVVIQLAVSVLLLGFLWHLSGDRVLERLTGANPWWVLAGLGFATVAMFAAAMRWRFTAVAVGAELGLGRSLREFYLASFLNQVLPGGILGDALRAWRHGKSAPTGKPGGMGRAVRAVLIERLASQMVVSLCMVVSLSLWPWLPGAFDNARIWVPLVGAATLVAATLIAIAVLARRHGGGQLERFLQDSRQALLTPRTLVAQLALGLAVTGSCVVMFYCAARAVHSPLSVFHLVALVPGALLAMSIPISIGGWGLREASAVALWTMAGLAPGAALASSVLYGMMSLLGALPGAVVLAIDR